MRPYSLSFFSASLEKEFSNYNKKGNLQIFKKSQLQYGLLALLFGIFAFIDNEWTIGTFVWLYAISTPLTYALVVKKPIYFDFICFIIQVAQNFGVPLIILLGIDIGVLSDSYQYMTGQAVAFITQSYNLGSRFYLKAVTILLNLVVQLCIKLAVKKEFTILTFFFIGTNFIALNNIYWSDRFKREAFINKYNENLWQSEIGKCAQISIFTCVSNEGQITLNYNKCNQTLKEEFKISSIDTLKLYLNNVTLIYKEKFSLLKLNTARLEQKFSNTQSLYSRIQKISEQSLTDSYEFIGLFNTQLYDVKIFTTWDDSFLNIHTLMQKSSIRPKGEIETMIDYERELYSNFRQSFADSIKTIIIKLKVMIQPQIAIEGPIMSLLYDCLRLNYNLQLFINPLYKFNRSEFLLGTLLKEVDQVISHKMPQPYKLDIQCLMNHDIKLNSCRKTIFHIIFNIYSTIIRSARRSGHIKIYVEQKSTEVGSIISFRIATNITTLQSIKQGQNLQRNNYGINNLKLIEDKKVQKIVKQSQFGLEITVSEYLIGQLGPFRSLKMIDCNITQPLLCFKLYQNLLM